EDLQRADWYRSSPCVSRRLNEVDGTYFHRPPRPIAFAAYPPVRHAARGWTACILGWLQASPRAGGLVAVAEQLLAALLDLLPQRTHEHVQHPRQGQLDMHSLILDLEV